MIYIYIKCVNIPPRLLLRKSSRIHNFNQEEIREKLQAFPGGSIDLLRQESGVAVLTVNNPSRMNAFSGKARSALWVSVEGVVHRWWFWFCHRRQHDGGAGGEGQSAGELDERERPYCLWRWWNILLWVRLECCQSYIQPAGWDEDVHVYAEHSHQAAQVSFLSFSSYQCWVKQHSLIFQFTD